LTSTIVYGADTMIAWTAFH